MFFCCNLVLRPVFSTYPPQSWEIIVYSLLMFTAVFLVCQILSTTSLKTNMSSENQWLEDVFPTEIVPF